VEGPNGNVNRLLGERWSQNVSPTHNRRSTDLISTECPEQAASRSPLRIRFLAAAKQVIHGRHAKCSKKMFLTHALGSRRVEGTPQANLIRPLCDIIEACPDTVTEPRQGFKEVLHSGEFRILVRNTNRKVQPKYGAGTLRLIYDSLHERLYVTDEQRPRQMVEAVSLKGRRHPPLPRGGAPVCVDDDARQCLHVPTRPGGPSPARDRALHFHGFRALARAIVGAAAFQLPRDYLAGIEKLEKSPGQLPALKRLKRPNPDFDPPRDRKVL